MSPSLRRRRSPATAGSEGSPSAPAEAVAPTATLSAPDPRGSAAAPAGGAAGTAETAGTTGATATTATTDTAARATAEPARAARRRTVADSTAALLLRAAHPRLGALVAAGLAVAAAISGRSGREVLLVLLTALVGQAVLGWHNDLVDRADDADRPRGDHGDGQGDSQADGQRQRRPRRKPLADDELDPGTAWFALICAVLLLVPLSIQNGVTAGAFYLVSVAVGVVGNVVLRRGWFSWAPWAVAWALYPFFLSYGGWGGPTPGDPPQPLMVVLAALVGVGVHVLTSLPGLVDDHRQGRKHLPLRVALRTGAPRLLAIAVAWTVVALGGLLLVGNAVGLSR